MKELNDWETQLQSWIPRRPSAKLEQRIFAAIPAPAPLLPHLRFSWVPAATAMALMMCVLFTQRNEVRFSRGAGVGPMVATILSNQSAAAYLPGSVQAEHNNVPADAFRWATSHYASSEAILPSRSRISKQP